MPGRIVVSAFAFFAAAVVGMMACSRTASDFASTTSTREYAGAGSDWRFTLASDNTFSATESETSTTISGTYATTSTGFQQLTVAAASGTHAPSVGSTLACTEIPGFAFVCKPILDTESQLVGTVVTGTCPTSDFTDNFLNIQFNLSTIDMTKTTGAFNQGSGNYDGDLFGTFKWDSAAKSGTPLTHYVVQGYTQIYPTSPTITGTCESGILTTTSFKAYLAPGAGLVNVTEAGSPNLGNTIITMPIQTLGSVSKIDGDYAGFLYSSNSGEIHPVRVTAASGALYVTGLAANLTDDDTSVNITAILNGADLPSAGFLEGNDIGAALICMAGTNIMNSGKSAVFCLGEEPQAHAKPYVLILGSK